jgi:hypothetical protein
MQPIGQMGQFPLTQEEIEAIQYEIVKQYVEKLHMQGRVDEVNDMIINTFFIDFKRNMEMYFEMIRIAQQKAWEENVEVR